MGDSLVFKIQLDRVKGDNGERQTVVGLDANALAVPIEWHSNGPNNDVVIDGKRLTGFKVMPIWE